MIIITIKIDTGEGSRVTFEGTQEDTTRLPDTMSEGKVSGTTKLPADTRVPSTKDPSTQGPSTQDPDTCTRDNCTRPGYSKGLCKTHYNRSVEKRYEPSAQALQLVAEFQRHLIAHGSLQQRVIKHEKAWAKAFDDLHRLDKLSWEEISEINDYALAHWVPRYCQAPTKYRTKSRSYPELCIWEVIQGQINGANESRTERTVHTADEILADLDLE